ncbi:MAG: S1/P1 nuclease [Alistipes sp.]|jgi:hypothetical protein|nr:S1/P1 nuclease [Alistipes sp.]
MKNYKIFGPLLVLAALLNWAPALGWGAKGHNAIAHIAQAHLTHRTQREVTRLLEGYNMAYWSAWADGLRDDHRYDIFSSWHYANADDGFTYASSPKNPNGDVYTAVTHCVEQLSSRETSDTLKGLYLKLLIHFVGDMHCPMHAGHLGDRGGNNHEVEFFGAGSNLHRLWDNQIVDSARPWSGLEWAWNIDRRMSRDARRKLVAGTPLDWMEETVALAQTLYTATPEGSNVSWSYVNRYSPLVEQKFLTAGHRLAHLLNQIFG